MSDITLHFKLPENIKVEKFISLLNEKTDLQIVSQQYAQKKFYDSFDWRLFAAGILCELNQSKSASRLQLQNIADGQIIASVEIDDVPAFAADFADPGLQTLLAPLLDMRALLSLTSLSYQAYRIDVLNKDRKTTVRLVIDDYELLPARVSIQPVRGYDKAAGRIHDLLEKKLALKTVHKTVLHEAMKLQGRKPLDYSSKLTIQLDPKMRADISCKYIYSHLLRLIQINESGTIASTDSEFLHDYRVAVRRTRTGLGQLKHILPAHVTAQFSAFFSWLSQITGPARDMDVYVLNFAGYQQSLPEEMRAQIAPLRDFLVRKQNKAQQDLASKLRSTDYISNLKQWEEYLYETVKTKPAEDNARLTIKQVADLRIWKVYRRVINEGRAITDQSPPEALHTLRKTCKKLRYLMEFFQCLYPEKKISRLIGSVKNFQTILGDFQDYATQEQNLKKFADELMLEKAPAETFIAMGVLVQNLHEKRMQARCEFDQRFGKFDLTENDALFASLFNDMKQRKS